MAENVSHDTSWSGNDQEADQHEIEYYIEVPDSSGENFTMTNPAGGQYGNILSNIHDPVRPTFGIV